MKKGKRRDTLCYHASSLASKRHRYQALERALLRLHLVGFLFLLGFCGIGWRLLDVAVFKTEGPGLEVGTDPSRSHAYSCVYSSHARFHPNSHASCEAHSHAHANVPSCAQSHGHSRGSSILSGRSDLVDRNGLLLATSLQTVSLYANPRVILNPKDAADQLHRVFPDLSRLSLYKKLSSGRGFVWIARHLTPALHARLLKLGIPGVYMMKDQRRVYPQGALFSHILGMTTWDHEGVSGLEKGLNAELKKNQGPVRLSLDIRFQHILREEINASVSLFRARGGNGILIKKNQRKKWEILAIVSLPDFDPHKFQDATSEELFNRNTVGVYEFGSLLKIHNTAMVLEKGVATLGSLYDASAPLHVGRFQITDFKGKNRPLSVQEAFLFSSNIANAKMALSAGAKAQQSFMRKLGFFQPASLEIPEVSTPLMPALWKDHTVITASYGYGLSITPIHLIQSVATLLDGHKRDLTFLPVENSPEDPGERVLPAHIVHQMRYLLKQAVLEGQARRASVDGYDVGGKTGTANMKEKGRYRSQNNLTSFVGAFPIEDPQYVLLVAVDRPQPNRLTHGYATAGWIAAPLASRIIKRIAPLLELVPGKNSEETDVDPSHLLAHAREELPTRRIK